MDESLVDVSVKEFEIGCPIVGKEWPRGRAMLRESQRHQEKGMI